MSPWFAASDPSLIPFIKMQHLGNHFIFLDHRKAGYELSAATIQKLCDAHFGVGAEQVVVLRPAEQSPAVAKLDIYNIDGTLVTGCGNATLCAALLLMDELQTDAIQLHVIPSLYQCHRQSENMALRMPAAVFREINWLPVRQLWQQHSELPPIRHIQFIQLSVPHLVIYTSTALTPEQMIRLGAQIQYHPSLPDSVNVGFATVNATDSISLTVYERPGILTQACGSGACAAVISGNDAGLLATPHCQVRMPGGGLQISLDSPTEAWLAGKPQYSFYGYINGEQYGL